MAILRPDEYQHTNPSYALLDEGQLRGASRTVQNISIMKNIPSDKRAVGMIVAVQFYDEGSEGATSGGEFKTLQYQSSDLTDSAFQNLSNWNTFSGAGSASAAQITYDNSTSGLAASEVQTAIDLLDAAVDTNTATIAGYGNVVSRDTGITNGNVVIVGIDGKIDAGLIPATYINTVTPVADIAERDALTPAQGDVAVVNDSDDLTPGDQRASYMWDGTTWIEISNPTDDILLSATVNSVDVTIASPYSTTNAVIPAATATLAGLLLPAEKTKLTAIEAGAQVNVKPDWDAPAADPAEILNKPTDITDLGQHVITSLSDVVSVAPSVNEVLLWNGVNWANGIITLDLSATTDAINNQVSIDIAGSGTSAVLESATITTPGLMSKEDKEKLDSIDSSAAPNVKSDWNELDNTSDAYIENKPTDVTDLSLHNLGDLGNVDLTGVGIGYTIKYNGSSWDVIALNTDITVTHVDTNNTVTIDTPLGSAGTINPATSSTPGIMPKEDKAKLDKINLTGTTGAIFWLDSSGTMITSNAPTSSGDMLVWNGTTWTIGTVSIPSTDLSITQNADSIDLHSSTGNDTNIPSATATLAGLMLPAEKNLVGTLDSGTAGQKVISNGVSGVSYEDDIAANVDFDPTGTNINVAATNVDAAIKDVDTRLNVVENTSAVTNLDAIVNQTNNTITITSSSGSDALLKAASTVDPGLLSKEDKAVIISLTAGTLGQKVLSNGTSGVYFDDDVAETVAYDNTDTSILSTDVQGAITELDGRVATLESPAAITATNVSYDNTNTALPAANVQAAIDSLYDRQSAPGIDYVPADPNVWVDPDPTNVKDALDSMANYAYKHVFEEGNIMKSTIFLGRDDIPPSWVRYDNITIPYTALGTNTFKISFQVYVTQEMLNARTGYTIFPTEGDDWNYVMYFDVNMNVGEGPSVYFEIWDNTGDRDVSLDFSGTGVPSIGWHTWTIEFADDSGNVKGSWDENIDEQPWNIYSALDWTAWAPYGPTMMVDPVRNITSLEIGSYSFTHNGVTLVESNSLYEGANSVGDTAITISNVTAGTHNVTELDYPHTATAVSLSSGSNVQEWYDEYSSRVIGADEIAYTPVTEDWVDPDPTTVEEGLNTLRTELTATTSSKTLIWVNSAATGANNGTSWEDAYTDITTAFTNVKSDTRLLLNEGTFNITAALASYSGLHDIEIVGGITGPNEVPAKDDYTTINASNGAYPYLSNIFTFTNCKNITFKNIIFYKVGTLSSNAPFTLNSVDGLTFDNVKFKELYATLGTFYLNSVKNLVFNGCTIDNEEATASENRHIIFYSPASVVNTDENQSIYFNGGSITNMTGQYGAFNIQRDTYVEFNDFELANCTNTDYISNSMIANGSGRIVMNRCKVHDNTGGSSIFTINANHPSGVPFELNNCLLYNNTHTWSRGGLFAFINATPTDVGIIRNCTIDGDGCVSLVGVHQNFTPTINTANSIFDNCILETFHLSYYGYYSIPGDRVQGYADLRNCIVAFDDGNLGTNTIVADPLFTDVTNDDYTLLPVSPAIGHTPITQDEIDEYNLIRPRVPFDISGEYWWGRKNYEDSVFDSGCFQYLGDTGSVEIYVDGTATGSATGTSWTDAYTTLDAALAQASTANETVLINIAPGVYTLANTGSTTTTYTIGSDITILGGLVTSSSNKQYPNNGVTQIVFANTADNTTPWITMGAYNSLKWKNLSFTGGAFSVSKMLFANTTGDLTFESCRFYDMVNTVASTGLYMDVDGVNDLTFQGCRWDNVSSTYSSGNGMFMYLTKANNFVFNNNYVGNDNTFPGFSLIFHYGGPVNRQIVSNNYLGFAFGGATALGSLYYKNKFTRDNTITQGGGPSLSTYGQATTTNTFFISNLYDFHGVGGTGGGGILQTYMSGQNALYFVNNTFYYPDYNIMLINENSSSTITDLQVWNTILVNTSAPNAVSDNTDAGLQVFNSVEMGGSRPRGTYTNCLDYTTVEEVKFADVSVYDYHINNDTLRSGGEYPVEIMERFSIFFPEYTEGLTDLDGNCLYPNPYTGGKCTIGCYNGDKESTGGGAGSRPIESPTAIADPQNLVIDDSVRTFTIADTTTTLNFTMSGLSDTEEKTAKIIIDNTANTSAISSITWPAGLKWDDSWSAAGPTGLSASTMYVLDIEGYSATNAFAVLIPIAQ